MGKTGTMIGVVIAAVAGWAIAANADFGPRVASAEETARCEAELSAALISTSLCQYGDEKGLQPITRLKAPLVGHSIK